MSCRQQPCKNTMKKITQKVNTIVVLEEKLLGKQVPSTNDLNKVLEKEYGSKVSDKKLMNNIIFTKTIWFFF